MGIFDKAKDMLGDERQTDSLLDKAEKFATDKLGQDKADQIKRVRDQIDERVGEGNPDSGSRPERSPEN